MKLWIRNQTRTEIMECNHLSVKETIVPNKKKSEWSIVANFGWVGAYESLERCLEIIDEIQKLLEVADPTKAFLSIECDEILDYNDVKGIIEFTRKHNAGYVPNGKVELIMPNVITYEMPEK